MTSSPYDLNIQCVQHVSCQRNPRASLSYSLRILCGETRGDQRMRVLGEVVTMCFYTHRTTCNTAFIASIDNSQRQRMYPVRPFFCLACDPNNQQILNHIRYRRFLRNDNYATACRSLNKLSKIMGHGFAVMRHQ